MKATLSDWINIRMMWVWIVFSLSHATTAQDSYTTPTTLDSSMTQSRIHEGFYLMIGLGPEFGNIKAYDNLGNRLEFEGTAYALDFQIGGVIAKNLILHATVHMKSIFGPAINNQKYNDDYSIDEFMMGAGVTYYVKNNYFLTGSIGSGNFSFVDENLNYTLDTDEGFSFQLKAGREWWISTRWALGFALEYGGTSIRDHYANGTQENWNSYRYGFRITGTLNGRR
jgi:hypothetical protein